MRDLKPGDVFLWGHYRNMFLMISTYVIDTSDGRSRYYFVFKCSGTTMVGSLMTLGANAYATVKIDLVAGAR